MNDRGLPLSDAAIFKAKIYGFLNDVQKEQFIKDWKALDERANESGESIQRLFYYYMFYLQAQEEDVNTIKRINFGSGCRSLTCAATKTEFTVSTK